MGIALTLIITYNGLHKAEFTLRCWRVLFVFFGDVQPNEIKPREHHSEAIYCACVSASACLRSVKLTLFWTNTWKGKTHSLLMEPGFVMEGALQMAVCCCKLKHELSKCI